jgi:hypothetical protein
MTIDEHTAWPPAPAGPAQPRLLSINGFHPSATTVLTSAVTEAVGGVTTTVGVWPPTSRRWTPSSRRFRHGHGGAVRLQITPHTTEADHRGVRLTTEGCLVDIRGAHVRHVQEASGPKNSVYLFKEAGDVGVAVARLDVEHHIEARFRERQVPRVPLEELEAGPPEVARRAGATAFRARSIPTIDLGR